MRFLKILCIVVAVLLFSSTVYAECSATEWALHPVDCSKKAIDVALKSLTDAPDENGSYPAISKSFQGDNRGCWFCGVFETLFDATNTLATTLTIQQSPTGNEPVLTKDAKALLYLGLLFYILFKVLKAVISFGEIDGKQFFTDLFMPILKCLMAMVVLLNLSSFYSQIVNPLAELSIGFATEIQSNGGGMNTINMNSRGGTTNMSNSCPSSPRSASSGDVVFDSGVHNAIQCFLETTSGSLMVYMAVAATFICDSFKLGFMRVFPYWSMLIVGICLFIGLLAIFLSFPFKLLDGMFRLMFVSALMPLWVVLWVLPQTRGYSKKAFDMFLNVLVTFIVLSVILLMCLTVMGAPLEVLTETTFQSALINGHTKQAFEMIDWSTGKFFILLAMIFLAFSLVGKTEEFVNSFVGGGVGGGMGSALQAAAWTGVGLAGSKLGKPLARKTLDVVKNSPKTAGFVAGRFAGGHGNPFRVTDIPGVKAARNIKKSFNEGYDEGFGKPKGGTTPPPGGGSGGGNTPPPGGGTPGGTPKKPQVKTSSSSETLAGGKTKETTTKTFTDADGNVTHKEVQDIIKNAKGEIESKIQKRENFDATTGVKTGTTEIATSYNKDGTSTQLKTNYDAMGKKKSTLETTNAGTTKKEFDEAGREKKITTRSRDGSSSVRTNSFDASGTLDSYIEEKRDTAGRRTEYFKMNVKTGARTDLPK